MSAPKSGLGALPTELIYLVVSITDAKGKPILSAKDVCNLRLASRRIQKTTFDGWAKRCFTIRKHMVSRASLQCLLSISTNPVLRKYVHEVAIGPERVNEMAGCFLGPLCRNEDDKEHWYENFEPKHRKLVEEQREFDTGDEAVQMLESALQGFPKLRHVRIDSYPGEEESDDKTQNGWTAAWGSKAILRDMGWGAYERWPEPRWAFLDEGEPCYGKIHGHYQKVLSALNGIEDRKDWTMGIAFHAMGWRYEERPLDLASRDWQRVRHRVTSLELERTSDYFEKSWIMLLLRPTSDNLRSLKMVRENSAHSVFRDVHMPALTHFVIQHSQVAPAVFKKFLFRHAKTLQSLEMCGVEIRELYLEDDAFHPSDFDGAEDSDSEDDEGSTIQKSKAKFIDPKDNTWFSIFEQLKTFPSLTSIRFACLRQNLT